MDLIIKMAIKNLKAALYFLITVSISYGGATFNAYATETDEDDTSSESEPGEMNTAVKDLARHHQRSHQTSRPDCPEVQTPSAQQCLNYQAPSAETFCPRDLNAINPNPRESFFISRLQKVSTQIGSRDQADLLFFCSLQNTKPLRALSQKEESKQRATIQQLIKPHLAKSPENSLAILKKLGELQRFAPDSDPSLALVIAERESGPRGYQKGTRTIDTFKSGGMDFLGEILPHMRRSIPPAYRDHWKSAELPRTNMAGHSGRPGLIPQNELVLAYGSFIHHRYSNFRRAAIKLGVGKERLDSLSPFARKAWQALFFASDAGLECVTSRRKQKDQNGKCELPKGGFGGMTVLTYLVKNGHSLEAILTNPEIAVYARARMAVEAARRAIAVERIIGMSCPPIINENS